MSQTLEAGTGGQPGSDVEREGVVQVIPRARTLAMVPPSQSSPPPEPPAPAAVPEPLQAPPPIPPVLHRPAPAAAPTRADSAAVGVLTALASVLAARLLLLLSVIFGFVLAIFAMREQSLTSLSILVAYTLLTVIPLVYLDLKTRVR